MLTAKQEKFVQGIIEGMSQADAYRSAYSVKRMTNKSIHEAASRLLKDSKIASRVKEIREQITSERIMSAQERLEWLTEVIKNQEVMMTDRLRASDQMNKMQGEYVQKVEADVNNNVTISIELSDD
jgi:phage terminase small subunit